MFISPAHRGIKYHKVLIFHFERLSLTNAAPLHRVMMQVDLKFCMQQNKSRSGRDSSGGNSNGGDMWQSLGYSHTVLPVGDAPLNVEKVVVMSPDEELSSDVEV
jgi:hypothetical protein